MTRRPQKMYTSNKISDNFRGPAENPKVAKAIFHGDSKDVLRGFPDAVKFNLGYALFQLELGQTPLDRKSVRAVGPGVYELRDRDADTWYRVLYERRGNKVHVLHCFIKQSNTIAQNDIESATKRRSRVLADEQREKKNVKRTLQGGKKR